MKITILNLNMGNLGSIPNMLKRFHCESIVTDQADDVLKAEKLILPGVGAFDAAMQRLNQLGLIPALNQKVLEEQIPTLGICLGMQLLANSSEEGQLPGLGWIPGRVARFHFATGRYQASLKVPHMGWNQVTLNRDIPLLTGYEPDPRFYFVHSYHYDPDSLPEDVQTATCQYGYTFPAVVQRGNVLGVQFHPEKSHRFGIRLFENFIRFNGKTLGEAIASPMMRLV